MKTLSKLKKLPGRVMQSALIATGINKVTDKDSGDRLKEIEEHAELINKEYERFEKIISNIYENGIKIPGREDSELTFEEKMQFLADLRKNTNSFSSFEFDRGSELGKLKSKLPEDKTKNYKNFIYKPLERIKALKNSGLLPNDRDKAREIISSIEDQTRKNKLFESISKLEENLINDKLEKGRAKTSDLTEKLTDVVASIKTQLISQLQVTQAYRNNHDIREVEENIMKSMSSLNLIDKSTQDLSAYAKENPKVSFFKRIKESLTKKPLIKNKPSKIISR